MKLKGIDGGPHKRRNMWFNSMIREEPYPGSNVCCMEQRCSFQAIDCKQGAAWLSSARAVRCRVKSHNERNPCVQLPVARPGTLDGLPAQAERKAGMTSNQHGPYVRGDTRVTMGRTEWIEAATRRESRNLLPVRIGVCNPTP